MLLPPRKTRWSHEPSRLTAAVLRCAVRTRPSLDIRLDLLSSTTARRVCRSASSPCFPARPLQPSADQHRPPHQPVARRRRDEPGWALARCLKWTTSDDRSNKWNASLAVKSTRRNSSLASQPSPELTANHRAFSHGLDGFALTRRRRKKDRRQVSGVCMQRAQKGSQSSRVQRASPKLSPRDAEFEEDEAG